MKGKARVIGQDMAKWSRPPFFDAILTLQHLFCPFVVCKELYKCGVTHIPLMVYGKEKNNIPQFRQKVKGSSQDHIASQKQSQSTLHEYG